VVCTVSVDGVECGHRMARHTGNAVSHVMRGHRVTEDEGERMMRERLASSGQKLLVTTEITPTEAEVLACAEGLRPFSMVEGRWFHAAFSPRIKTGEAMKSHTLALAEKLRDRSAKKMEGRTATVCFDSGTVFNRYLAIVVVAEGLAPFSLGLVRDSEFEDGRLTAANVGGLLSRTVGDLLSRGIHCIAVVADNAANFQADDCQVDGVLHLRCAAHSLQLAAKDILDRWPSLGDDVKFFCEAHGHAQPCVTRWNSTYDVALAIADGKAPANEDEFRRIRSIKAMLPVLKPYAVATDFVQRDDATIFGQLRVLQFFFAEKVEVPAARVGILTHNVRLLAYFFPNARRAAIPRDTFDLLRAEFCAISGLTVASFGPETLQDSVAAEWLSFSVSPPPPTQGDVSEKMFLDWWAAAPYRRIRFLVLKIASASPTEASVERLFSKLKISFSKLRNSLLDDGLVAQLVCNSAVNLLETQRAPKKVPEWLPENGSDYSLKSDKHLCPRNCPVFLVFLRCTADQVNSRKHHGQSRVQRELRSRRFHSGEVGA